MQPILKRLPLFMIRAGLCAAITLGLTTGSALAVEVSEEDYKLLQKYKQTEAGKQQPPTQNPVPDKGNDVGYDHSGEPHETPHKVEPPTGGHPSLATAATNPIANLVQFQLQNNYNWDNHNSDGYSNQFLLQPVVPIKLPSEKVPLLITRTTVPYVSTPDLGSPEHRKHGFGDTTFLALAVPDFKLDKTTVGLGISSVIPTAGDNDFTGNGKWQLGPAFVYFNQQIPGLQWGALGWHRFTVGETSSGSDKKNVTVSSIQPVLIKHWGKGWYLGVQDVTWDYNHKSEEWTLPMGPRLGRVFKPFGGKQAVNLFGAVYYNPNDDGPTSTWTAKVNLTLLFPK